MHSLKLSILGLTLLAMAVFASFRPSSLRADDSTPTMTKQEVKELIKNAKTPEDHMKLARYYRQEAEKLREEAKDHQEMGAEYIHRISPKFPTMSEHCKDVSNYVMKAAQKADELAAGHEQMAKAAANPK